MARPPAEATPPLAYLVRRAAALSALDIERTSNTAHEEETNWSLWAAGVSPQVPALSACWSFSTSARTLGVATLHRQEVAHPDQLALEAYFASSRKLLIIVPPALRRIFPKRVTYLR